MDSSVRIDFFSSAPGVAGAELRRLIRENGALVLAGVIISEILQALTRDARAVERFLAQFKILEPKADSERILMRLLLPGQVAQKAFH